MTSIEDMDRLTAAAEWDAIRHMIADLPDARCYAEWLTTIKPDLAVALLRAWKGKQWPYAQEWRVADDQYAPQLRKLGLIGWVTKDDGLAVTGFGNKVRKCLLGEDE